MYGGLPSFFALSSMSELSAMPSQTVPYRGFLMKIPAVYKPCVEVFQALDGHGQLWSPCGQFLGQLSSQTDPINSIINPTGDYGSPFSLTSIHNPQCQYGGDSGKYSPFNPNCKNPPVVFYRTQPLFVLSTNPCLYTNDLNVIDPYLLLSIYEALGNVPPNPLPQPSSQPTRVRTWDSYRDLKEKLMQLSGSAFGLARAN